MIYVDNMTQICDWCWGWGYNESCHLMADTDAELEEFAKRLGLRKSWRHGDHYDLTANKRRAAIKAGATAITQREMVEIRKARRNRSRR